MTTPEAITAVNKATTPEDLFGVFAPGVDKEGQERLLTKAFRRFAVLLHPDKAKGKRAEDAFKKLNEHYEIAADKVGRGKYGDKNDVHKVVITSKNDNFVVTSRVGEGALSSVYRAINKRGHPVILKVVRNLKDSDLLANEAKVLMGIHAQPDHKSRTLRANHIADLLTSFDIVEEKKVRRRANVLVDYKDYIPLSEILRGYPHGLELADAAWIMNRILGGLVAAYDAGYVYGALNPDHVLIEPKNHSGVLIDWSYAVKHGEKIKAIEGKWKSLYAPEVLGKLPATPATDVYMAGALGLNMVKPTVAPAALRVFKTWCLSPFYRPATALDASRDFQEMLTAVFGERKFKEFVWPPKK